VSTVNLTREYEDKINLYSARRTLCSFQRNTYLDTIQICREDVNKQRIKHILSGSQPPLQLKHATRKSSLN